jgi:hypothetical protein
MQHVCKVLFELEALGAHLQFFHMTLLSRVNRDWNANPDKKIKWNVYSFDEGMASRVPYEAAARVLPQSKRSFAGYAVRQGLAIAMEHFTTARSSG